MNKTCIADVHFLPFVGENYLRGICEKKVLVLGESIYGKKQEDMDADATKRRIEWYLGNQEIAHEGWMNTYTKFIRALSGNFNISRSNSKQWWNKVIFYNYIQEPLDDTQTSPSKKMFHDGEKPLLNVLERYAPDVILVWGLRLGEHLPPYFGNDKNVVLPDDVQAGTKKCTINSHSIRALIMYHPCNPCFCPSKWNEMISQFMNE